MDQRRRILQKPCKFWLIRLYTSTFDKSLYKMLYFIPNSISQKMDIELNGSLITHRIDHTVSR
jgi:hypothetical protein